MDNNFPRFSIVIPTHNRPRQIDECLAAISELNYLADRFEVIVVDDGATLSPTIIEKFQDRFALTLHQQKKTGPAQARNNGAKLSKFDFLVFTDDDCLPDKNWLIEIAKQFKLSPGDCIGGKIINSLTANIYSAASQQLIDYLYDYFGKKNSDLYFFASNNLAVPKIQFQLIGGFDPTFPLPAAEDRDFCRRWLEKKYKLTHQPQAIVYHAHQMNFRGFWRQHFNYGRGAYHFHKTLKKRSNQKIKREPSAFYLKLVMFPFKKKIAFSNLKTSNLLLISQIAMTFGYIYQRFGKIN